MEENLKQLLLKDLSSRLPYGVECLAGDVVVGKLVGIAPLAGDTYLYLRGVLTPYRLDEVKPYLRSMDDMTKEERNYYEDRWFEGYHCKHGDDMVSEGEIPCYIDWLLENHFDYRGLIEKGLAIEVTKENNPYKE